MRGRRRRRRGKLREKKWTHLPVWCRKLTAARWPTAADADAELSATNRLD